MTLRALTAIVDSIGIITLILAGIAITGILFACCILARCNDLFRTIDAIEPH